MALERQDQDGADIWVHEVSGTTNLRRLTEGADNRFPVWIRDGEYVAFQSDREGDRGIFQRRSDGTGSVDRLTSPEPETAHVPEAWSPNNDRLAFSVSRGNRVELWMMTLADGEAVKFGDLESINMFDTVFSPDGEWIAYTQRGVEVSTWVHSVSDPETRYQIGQTEENVHHPLFTRDGTQLIYSQGANPPVSVDIRTQPSFGTGPPIPVAGLAPGGDPERLVNLDSTPDGRIVAVEGGLAEFGGNLNNAIVVQNWFEELKELVPVE